MLVRKVKEARKTRKACYTVGQDNSPFCTAHSSWPSVCTIMSLSKDSFRNYIKYR